MLINNWGDRAAAISFPESEEGLKEEDVPLVKRFAAGKGPRNPLYSPSDNDMEALTEKARDELGLNNAQEEPLEVTEEMAEDALKDNSKMRRQEAFKAAQQKRVEKTGHAGGNTVAARVNFRISKMGGGKEE